MLIDLELLINATCLAVLGWVFVCKLQGENDIFEWYGDFLTWVSLRVGKWLAYPLGYCPKCFAGQLCFWFFVYKYHSIYTGDILIGLITHAVFIAVGIIVVIITNRIFAR